MSGSGARGRLRVHVSSEPGEPDAERRAVRDAVEALRLAPVLSAELPPELPVDVRRTAVAAADLFVGVYGARYGDIDPATGLSPLEAEYLAAGDRPRLIYVRAGADPDPHLAVLLARVQADDLVSYRRFGSPEELGRLVRDDLAIVLAERWAAPATPTPTAASPPPQARPVTRSLPQPPTELLGRDRLVTRVLGLLASGERLVTLTGPGGIGKTRVALEVGRRYAEAHPGTVALVDLAGIRDPALVAPTIAHALGVRESAGVAPVESLKAYLGPLDGLLLLDSFELVAAAGPLLVDLLVAAPAVRFLVTSRSVLRVRGEREVAVPPLAVPAPGGEGGERLGGDLEQVGSVALFLDRAVAAAPGLVVGDEELQAVAEICRRLDGVPLAIELAAARCRVLAPQDLLARLGHRLDLLRGGARDLPERQRTLRATLDWDHELLEPEERVLFRRLAGFARGWTFATAEEVVGDVAIDLLEGMDGLVGKSLVRVLEPTPTGEPRFGMLQTVREYAAERLAAAGEAEAVRRRHAEAHLRLAEQGRAAMVGPEQAAWLTALEQAHEELRSALRWADGAVEVDLLLRLAAALGVFWRVHAHFTEGRRWLARALALSAGQRSALRVELLNADAFLARAGREYDTAEARYREAIAIREELGDVAGVTRSLRFLGNLAYDRGDVAGARELWEQSLLRTAPGEDLAHEAAVHNNLGLAAWLGGDLDAAEKHYAAALPLAERLDDTEMLATLHMNLGSVAVEQGDAERGAGLARESIARFASFGDSWDMVDAVEFLAGALGAQGRAHEAGWLFGAAAALREAIAAARSGGQDGSYARDRHRAEQVDPAAFAEGLAGGASASLDELVRFALATGPRVQAVP